MNGSRPHNCSGGFFNMLNKLQTISYFTVADWTVFSVILVITAAAAVYGSLRLKRTKENSEANSVLDYLLMGRQLTLPLFVATMVATWYGGIFGVNEITFNYGIYNFVTQGFFWYAAYLVFAFFVADKIVKYKSVTLPDLTRQLFGENAATVSAAFTLLSVLPVAYVLSVGLFLHMVFGISVLKGMILGTFFSAVFAAWGGLRSVVFSDVVQFVVMCAAVFIVAVFSVHTFGGFTFLKAHLPPSHLTLTGGNSWANTLVWGFIAFSALINPAFYQRCFAAKNIQTVKRGVLISTLIWFLFDICTTTGSLYARAVLPDAQPGQAYFFYAIQLLPSGLRGFFVAGVLAIILSTLNSFLFLSSNTLSFDLLKNRFSNVILSSRFTVFIAGALSIGLVQLFHESFKEIWFVLGSYLSACLLVPVLIGQMFPHAISDRLFVTSVFTSATTMTLWRVYCSEETLNIIDPFYIGITTSIIILVLFRKGVSKNVARIIDR